MTKWYLFSLLALHGCERRTVHCAASGKYVDGIVCAIERESGDGSSFIVSLDTGAGARVRVFVRTLDELARWEVPMSTVVGLVLLALGLVCTWAHSPGARMPESWRPSSPTAPTLIVR